MLNGLSVANPDYRPHWEYQHRKPACGPEVSPFHRSVPIGLAPRSLGTARIVSDPPMWADEIGQSADGELALPRLGEWGMSAVIRSLGIPGSPGEQDTVTTLSGVRDDFTVQAVVELRSPLPEAGIADLWATPEVLFFSPAGPGKPLGWDWDSPGLNCDGLRGFGFCEGGRSATSAFRIWVSLLTEGDAPALEQIGLDLDELRRRADAGMIHGFVMSNLPGQVARVSRDPRVASVTVIDMVPWVAG
ncbi:hypothetical protein GCM10023259_089730 [Thermocatellispora tengchongensis]